MLRLKYYSLNKEEKKNLKKEFYQTEFGNSIKRRLNRLLIIGILGTLFSIYLFLFHANKWDIVSGIILLIASFVFITGSFKLKTEKLNNFLIKKAK